MWYIALAEPSEYLPTPEGILEGMKVCYWIVSASGTVRYRAWTFKDGCWDRLGGKK